MYKLGIEPAFWTKSDEVKVDPTLCAKHPSAHMYPIRGNDCEKPIGCTLTVALGVRWRRRRWDVGANISLLRL